MRKELSSAELAIVDSFADVAETAIYLNYDLEDFFVKALKTDCFARFPEDYTLYSQSDRYILNKIKKDLTEQGETILPAYEWQRQNKRYVREIAYWIGYVFMYWRHLEQVPVDTLQRVSLERMVTGYDTLHTQSVEYAIRTIKSGYFTDKQQPLGIFR